MTKPEDESHELTGGCACGAVRYRLTPRPMFVHCCHCQDCQRQTGSAFVVNALYEADRVEVLQGELASTRMPTESGSPHDVWRCAGCGTALWSIYGGKSAVRFVRATTLDRPDALAPDVHIFTRSKLPWVGLPAETPAFEVYYDPQTLWPAESLARRRAVVGDL